MKRNIPLMSKVLKSDDSLTLLMFWSCNFDIILNAIHLEFFCKFRKNRRLKPISLLHMWNHRREFEITERNMLILRHPYLTVEQSAGHTRHLRQQKIDEFYANIHAPKNEAFAKKSTTLAEKFNNLRITESWD